MSYYAMYDLICSDVAVFKTKAARDDWVENGEPFFERVAISSKEMRRIVGYSKEAKRLFSDPVDDHIKWLTSRITRIRWANMPERKK